MPFVLQLKLAKSPTLDRMQNIERYLLQVHLSNKIAFIKLVHFRVKLNGNVRRMKKRRLVKRQVLNAPREENALVEEEVVLTEM